MWSNDERHNEECGQITKRHNEEYGPVIKGTGSTEVLGGEAVPVRHCSQHPHGLPWN